MDNNSPLYLPMTGTGEAQDGSSAFHEFDFCRNTLETSSAFVDQQSQIILALTDTTEFSKKHEPNEFLLREEPMDFDEPMDKDEMVISDQVSVSTGLEEGSESESNSRISSIQIDPQNIEQTSTENSCPVQNPGQEPSNTHDYDPNDFLEHFYLKSENMRQTVLRRFKATMKKAYALYKKWKNSDHGKMFQKMLRKFNLLYLVQQANLEESQTIFQEMCSLFEDVDTELFEAKYNTSSCNGRYVQFLFNQTSVKKLYMLHLKMARKGRIYFEKFSQFKGQNLTSQEQEMVFVYCEHLI